MIGKDLYSQMEAAGFLVKTFRIEHLEEISSEFERFAAEGLINEDFYKNNLADFRYDYSNILKDAKSVIVIAVPQYRSVAEFEYGGKILKAPIPPTYRYPAVDNQVISVLDNILIKNNHSLTRAKLPLKLIAVRSGIGQYGRNNVCYIPGRGSFNRLLAFITDCEFEDNWRDIKVMECCSTCSACINFCPTGAITKDKFIIDAHNCITNFNEYETAIPEWVKPDWHDSIVGCMRCQTVCPQNMELVDLVDEIIFFEEKETEMILGGSAINNLPIETKNKIFNAGMEPYYNVLPRNIRLLMDKM